MKKAYFTLALTAGLLAWGGVASGQDYGGYQGQDAAYGYGQQQGGYGQQYGQQQYGQQYAPQGQADQAQQYQFQQPSPYQTDPYVYRDPGSLVRDGIYWDPASDGVSGDFSESPQVEEAPAPAYRGGRTREASEAVEGARQAQRQPARKPAQARRAPAAAAQPAENQQAAPARDLRWGKEQDKAESKRDLRWGKETAKPGMVDSGPGAAVGRSAAEPAGAAVTSAPAPAPAPSGQATVESRTPPRGMTWGKTE